MKKLFGGVNLTWKMVIISAILIGVSVGLLNSVPQLKDTTISDIATIFDFWIFCGIFIIMNSKSNKDSALKCFVFFLISQPLIYLVEVPFNSMGWQLFIYYKYWFMWTILTLPMGYLGYYIKNDKWYGLLMLIPMLLILAPSVSSSLEGLIYSFPHHLINLIFVIATMIIYPLALFNNKYLKYIGLAISIILIIFFGIQPILNRPSYETDIACSGGSLDFDENYKVSFADSSYGDISFRYVENVDAYCIHTKFYKPGDTKLILEDPQGNKQEYDIHIGKNTYSLDTD